MNIKREIKDIRTKLYIVRECILFMCRLLKYNASLGTEKDIQKMQYTLLRETHVIEKGLSMRNTKKDFGRKKVCMLLSGLKKYHICCVRSKKSENIRFLLYPLSVIRSYLAFNEKNGLEIVSIKNTYSDLLKITGFRENDLDFPAGFRTETRKNIQELCKGSFADLLKSRHSIRYFTEEIPPQCQIETALNLAKFTPSACNRQAWKTHVFFADECHELFTMQGGCSGFENDIHCAILVCADMKGYLSYEIHQCYIDGGLYAMNLLNALHSLGLGTIPLSCGFYEKKIRIIKEHFAVPQSEEPVMIIGTGFLCDQFKVAASARKEISQTNSWHGQGEEETVKTYIGHAMDENCRFNGAGGGVVSTLIKYLFDKHLISTAISFSFNEETLRYIPKFIYSFNEYETVGSIYHEIDLIRFIKQNTEKIHGTFACCSLPCQSKGIRSIVEAAGHHCFIIGLVCSSQQSFEATEFLLTRLHIRLSDVYKIRYRGGGWPGGIRITMKDKTEKFIPNGGSLWTQIFHSRLFVMPRCLYCSDTFNKDSDIAVADPWIKEYLETESIGKTLIFDTNEKWTEILAVMALENYIDYFPVCENTAIFSQMGTIRRKEAYLKNGFLRRTLLKMNKSRRYKAVIRACPALFSIHCKVKNLLERIYTHEYK